MILPPLNNVGAQHAAPLLDLSGFCNYGSECRWFADCHIRENLAVEFDVCLFQVSHQFAIGGPIQTSRGIDAGDPQLAHVTLADAAITSCVPQTFEHGLIGTL